MGNLKKGAMFGLDARIALAIFGVLSVISGVALFSAIQSAKAEQLREYFVEIVKATEAYYLDNAVHSTVAYSSYQELRNGLGYNSDNLSTWNGPYFQISENFYNGFKDVQTNSLSMWAITMVRLRKGSDWSEMNDRNVDEICDVGSSNCYQWITLSANADSSVTVNLLQMFKNLDELVDGSDGSLKGKVRYSTDSDGAIMYKGMPYKRTS